MIGPIDGDGVYYILHSKDVLRPGYRFSLGSYIKSRKSDYDMYFIDNELDTEVLERKNARVMNDLTHQRSKKLW